MLPEEELVAAWLSKADDDLRMAELAMGSAPPICWAAGFHAQQAAEKLLKALLTRLGVEYEKTHDLGYLLDLCLPAHPEARSLREGATRLTGFAVESRYPFPGRAFTEAEGGEAIAIARHVREFVRSRCSITET
jgi:HEPN domain-containing protein